MSCPSSRTVRELNLGGWEESKVERRRKRMCRIQLRDTKRARSLPFNGNTSPPGHTWQPNVPLCHPLLRCNGKE
jgi:hypothetical protein